MSSLPEEIRRSEKILISAETTLPGKEEKIYELRKATCRFGRFRDRND